MITEILIAVITNHAIESEVILKTTKRLRKDVITVSKGRTRFVLLTVDTNHRGTLPMFATRIIGLLERLAMPRLSQVRVNAQEVSAL
jgi:hypothetical protein